MMSRNGSVAGGPGGRTINHMPTSIRPKKKPAPPRPPQPKINKLQTSLSFNTAQDLAPNNFPNARPAGKDLIDFKTPPSSPGLGRRNTVALIGTALKDPMTEFSYRVGASVFYIKSPLKNSASETPVQNPFSPPRPNAESIATNTHKPIAGGNLQSSINAAWGAAKPVENVATAWDTPPHSSNNSNKLANITAHRAATGSVAPSQFQTSSSLENNNTIKSNYQSPWLPAGASSNSNASSESTSFSDHGPQYRYSNVPETGKKELTATMSVGSGVGSKKPTIIRPANKLSSHASLDASNSGSQAAHAAVINSLKNRDRLDHGKGDGDAAPMQRNYYDLPPDEEEEEDDDLNNSNFTSPPMPSEPPPPPPPDVQAVDDWVSTTTSVTDYPDTYSDSGQTTAYAIALYDFVPETQGDLQLQAGDLVYLLRKVDDSWYHGSCGGMEGMFPSNFVNVMVPLPEEVGNIQQEMGVYADVLYDFVAETDGDLGIQVGEKVNVLGRINEDWLYGEKNGTKGQFPAAFVDHISQDLPIIKA